MNCPTYLAEGKPYLQLDVLSARKHGAYGALYPSIPDIIAVAESLLAETARWYPTGLCAVEYRAQRVVRESEELFGKSSNQRGSRTVMDNGDATKT